MNRVLKRKTDGSTLPRRVRLRVRVGVTAVALAGASLAVVTGNVPGAHPAAVAPHTVNAPAMRPVAIQNPGYWLVASDGGIFPFGSAGGFGSTGNVPLNQPIVGMAASPDRAGYWLVAADGGIFPFGSAKGHGSTGATHLNQPIVGMAATTSGNGYWLVARDGGIFPFGSAGGFGSTGGMHLNQPIVGMARTQTGKGYWLVASDGGIFPFGDAIGYGSTGGSPLNQPIVGMAAMPSGKGYWLVASDGGIFPFGAVQGYGSTGAMHLNKPIVGMAAAPDGRGYWLVASDGGIFPFGSAPGLGSTGGTPLNKPIVGMAAAGQALGTSDKVIGTPGATTITAGVGQAGVLCTFTLTDQIGKPISQADMLFSTSNLRAATLSAPSAQTDANGQVSVTMTDSTAGETGTVDATIAGTGVRGTAGPFTISASTPSTMAATPNVASQVTADNGNHGIKLTFNLRDAQNNPVAGFTIALTQTGLPHAAFNSTSPITDKQGTAVVTMTDTYAINPADSGTVTGTAQGTSPALSATTATITITPGNFAKATLALSGNPGTIVAGSTGTTGVISIFDTYNNPAIAPAAGLSFTMTGSATTASPNNTASSPAPNSTISVSSGQSQSAAFPVTPTRAQPGATLTATAAPAQPASVVFTVTGAPATSTPFQAPAISPNGTVAVPSALGTQLFTISNVEDAFGNLANGGTINVTLTGTSTPDQGTLTPAGGSASAPDAATTTVTVTMTIGSGASAGTGTVTYTAFNSTGTGATSGTITTATTPAATTVTVTH